MFSHAAALKQSKKLGKISDENMVYYYTPELVFIGKGQKATGLLPDAVIQHFIRLDILMRSHGRGGNTLTEKGKDIIRKTC